MFAMTAGYCYELIEDLGLLLFGGLPVAPTQRSEDFTALPFLGAMWGENGSKARHQFADPGDGVPNRLAGTIQVQD
jgi:hypothetical protein